MNLFDLFRDAFYALTFRYKPALGYLYGLPVFLAVALAIGVTHAVTIMPALGNTIAVFAFGVILGIGRWLLLTRCMTSVLHYFGTPQIPFIGYTLATEALVLPNILLFYYPDLSPFLTFWNIWIFWAQLAGFAQISGQKGRSLVCAYLTYFATSALFSGLIFALFLGAGWLDTDILLTTLKQYIEQGKP